MQKILVLAKVTKTIQDEKSKGKQIVLVGGVFDILHFGHLRFLQRAKKEGDILVVALEPDSKVRKLKGNGRPINNEKIRAQMVAALACVDYVIVLPELSTDEEYFYVIEKLSPHVIAVTEGDPKLREKQQQADAIGSKVKVVTPKIPTPTTSQLAKLLAVE